MYYAICNLCPRSDISMGAHGFTISLHKRWRELVANCDLDQTRVDKAVSVLGRSWLDSCGYKGIFDPDNCGATADRSLPPGPNARPLYEANRIRVDWGEWGAEHISVPGSACGLGIERHNFGSILRGPALVPHNIDCWQQKQLLLIVFCWFAESIIIHTPTMKLDAVENSSVVDAGTATSQMPAGTYSK